MDTARAIRKAKKIARSQSFFPFGEGAIFIEQRVLQTFVLPPLPAFRAKKSLPYMQPKSRARAPIHSVQPDFFPQIIVVEIVFFPYPYRVIFGPAFSGSAGIGLYGRYH